MDVTRGAAAGLAATIPMTLAMETARAMLPGERNRRMPPREIVDRTIEKTAEPQTLDSSERTVLTGIAHFAFGAAAGAVYGLLVGARRSNMALGVGYGLAVWATAYGVGLPSLGLHPAAARDTPDRNEVLIASHVVWGAALGILLRD
jgi:uncharacterized membrane protein YagU involved in acid resistance